MTRLTDRRYSRRQWLRRNAVVAGSLVAPLVVPAVLLGRDGGVAPGNRITIGSIGVGRMGRGHLRLFTERPEVELLALSDVDPWRRDAATQTLERAYGARQA